MRWAAFLLAAGLSTSCYSHARRDAPAAAPKDVVAPMVSIPTGSFTMGDNSGEPDEYPERKLQMQGFRIDRMEVTNAAYRACVAAKACDPAAYLEDPDLGQEDHPVVGVTWEDAERFCAWLGKRLPTEAEWEYAAKGADFRKWPWTGAFDAKNANTVQAGDFHGKTAPVNAYEGGESPFGVLQMAGNVAEWTADYFDPTHYRKNKDTTDPAGPKSGRERVVRGGSYRDTSHTVRVAARRAKAPTEVDNTIGFRCADE
ncbi:MAG: SUMF1/EgtB/PvdO family nonheme iron enzyme [Deltaproteobacteria bacterium]